MIDKRVKYLAEAILTPLSYIYKAIVVVRNWMFDAGILPQEEFDVPVGWLAISMPAVPARHPTPSIL